MRLRCPTAQTSKVAVLDAEVSELATVERVIRTNTLGLVRSSISHVRAVSCAFRQRPSVIYFTDLWFNRSVVRLKNTELPTIRHLFS